MTYNLVKKNVPSLIEQNIIKGIAKHNNIDYKTGIPLKSVEQSRFSIICKDIRDDIFCFFKNNLLLFSIIFIVVCVLYYRYTVVKKEKILIESNNIKKQKLNKTISKQLNEQLYHNNLSKLEMDNIRSKYELYDDSTIRQMMEYDNYFINGIKGVQ